MHARLALLLCGLAATACVPRKVPNHLKVSPDESGPEVLPPTSLAEAVSQLVDTDPLVRRPRPRSAEWWASADGAEPILAWLDAGSSGTMSVAALDALEANGSGTVAVALARGARLAELEVTVPTAPADERGDRTLVLWLGAFTIKPVPGRSDVRPPLGWIASDRSAQRQGLIRLAERAVLAGWLEAPDLPVDAVARAMAPSQYDRLRASPEGELILGRAAGASDPPAAQAGQAELQAATTLALVQAAADGLRSRKAAQALSQSMAHDRGLSEGGDPLPPMLETARKALTADAGHPPSVGHALVALAAQRLDGQCSHPPCTGVDRVSTLHLAARQSPEVESTAWAWRLIAAKTASDRLEVSIEEKLPTSAFPLVADIIVGETGRRVPLSLLLQRAVGPEAALAITRGFGAPDGTTPQDALSALQDHIQALCTSSPASVPDAWDAPIDAICTSAQSPAP